MPVWALLTILGPKICLDYDRQYSYDTVLQRLILTGEIFMNKGGFAEFLARTTSMN